MSKSTAIQDSPKPAARGGSNTMTWILVAAVVALVGFNIWYVVTRDAASGDARVNSPAPNFTLSLLEPNEALGGSEVELASLQGKAVVLEFWATTCGACREGFPVIEALHREGRDDVVVLTVNTEGTSASRARRAVSRYFSRFGYTVPVLMDNGSVSRAYGVEAIPHTVIIDKDGRIASMHTGVMAADTLRRQLDEALDH